jgi:signal transduction histidine kinase
MNRRQYIGLFNESIITFLDPQDLQFMFDPLWQKVMERTSNQHFGLGLSIVRSFCKALNGRVKASIVDDETHFIVELKQLA